MPEEGEVNKGPTVSYSVKTSTLVDYTICKNGKSLTLAVSKCIYKYDSGLTSNYRRAHTSINRTSSCPASSPMWYVVTDSGSECEGANSLQEKLNEAVVVMNKSLQVELTTPLTAT